MPSGTYQRRKDGESLQIVLLVAVDVQMVGVGARHHGQPGMQLVERTVVFVGLDDGIARFLVQHEVGACVAQYAAEESGATGLGAAQYVGYHRRRGGLAVRAGHADAVGMLRDAAQQRGALDDAEAVPAEIFQYVVVFGNGGSVDHKGILRVAERLRDGVAVVKVGELQPFLFKSGSQFRGSAVVSGHGGAMCQVITHQVGHSDTPGPHEI